MCFATPPRWTCFKPGLTARSLPFGSGHETLNTVQVYLHANLKLKEQALAKTAPVGAKAGRYHPDDRLLGLLEKPVIMPS